MIRIGLTGSIGMGKSTVLEMFVEFGAAVWNADDAVHRLYAKGGAAVAAIATVFPEAVFEGAVDRARLAAVVLKAPEKLKRLEAIVHPLVAEDRERFIAEAEAAGEKVVVLDIPLLYEGGSEDAFDAVVVVSAPAGVQRVRVLARPGMTEEKFQAILAEQLPDAEKRARADYVIDTGQTLNATKAEARAAYDDIIARFAPRG